MNFKKKSKDLGEIEVKFQEGKKLKKIKEKISKGLNRIADKIKKIAKKVKN
jgi:hypothetical protein